MFLAVGGFCVLLQFASPILIIALIEKVPPLSLIEM
jgi:hypothetical protein